MSASSLATTPDTILATTDVRSVLEGIPLWAWQVLFLAALVLSVGVAYGVARPRGRWGQRLRTRFVLAIPWGTVLGLGVVMAVYLFVQGGLAHRFDPVSLPFRATSYAYPLGVLLAGFAHLGWSHLLGNLFSGLVFGSIAEYAWSHYPTGRGAQSFETWLANPYVRIGLFFGAILVTGLLTAAFSWGPIIGFSGVVFALAGFALVFYPIATVVAVVGWGHLWHVWSAFVDPFTIAEPAVRYSDVGFANTAVQGHAFGFLIGVLLAALLIRSRDRSASPGRIWLATVIYAIANGLWSVYWYLGDSQYIRFKTVGTVFILGLAGLIVLAVAGSDRPLLGRLGPLDVDVSQFVGLPSRRRAATGIIVFTLLGMSMVGAIVNLSAPSGADVPEDAVEVRDYRVAYAENITNEQLAIVDIPYLDQVSEVRTSGVVVYSDQRRLWHRVISKRALEARGSGRVLLGGIRWRRAVEASRSGWSVVGGDVTYRVFLQPDGGDRQLVHTADPVVADLVIENRTVAIRPAADAFEVVVRRDNETLDSGPVPANNETATLGAITFERVDRDLYGSIDGTELRVASRRQPPTSD